MTVVGIVVLLVLLPFTCLPLLWWLLCLVCASCCYACCPSVSLFVLFCVVVIDSLLIVVLRVDMNDVLRVVSLVGRLLVVIAL